MESAKIFECEYGVYARSRKYNTETISAHAKATTTAFYPLCKSMQNNAAVLPAQSDADVTVYACMHTLFYAYRKREQVDETTSTRWSS